MCVCMFISGGCYVFGDVLRVSSGSVGFLGNSDAFFVRNQVCESQYHFSCIRL